MHDPTLREESFQILSSLSYRDDNFDEYLDRIAAAVAQLLNVDWAAITLLVEEDKEKVLASSLASFDTDRLYEYHGSVSNTVLRTGEPLVIPNASVEREYGDVPPGYCAYLGVPLINVQGHSIGTICTFHKSEREYSEEQVRIAAMFAERAAVAIDNYELYRKQVNFNAHLEIEVTKRTEELKCTQARLVERERLAAIGEFAAGIAHEIRSPLSTVSMALEYMDRLDIDRNVQRRVSLAQAETLRMTKLISEILAYAKPQDLQSQPLTLRKILGEVVEIVRTKRERAHCDVLLESDEAAVRVLGDPEKLRQVFINIIENACDASPEGESIRVAWEHDGTDKVAIYVKNRGAPIPDEIIPRLTEPFYGRKPNGTGLGLAIVKRIVDAHEGKLHIRSSPAKGTIVSVALPAA